MKKILYGTTALVTAGLVAGIVSDAAAQERIKLNIAGYSQFWMVGLDQEFNDGTFDANTNPTGRTFQGGASGLHNSSIDFKQNAEVCFTGQTTLDNGISVGVQVQLEANGEIGTQNPIDESFVFVQSDTYGQLVLGADDGVADKFHVQAPNGGMSIDGGGDFSTNNFVLNTNRIGTDDTTPEFTSDDTKATYITPRFFGFQAGVSYTPQDTGFGQRSPNYKANGFYHDAVSGGLNYRNTFSNGFGMMLSGGVEYGNTNTVGASGTDKGLFAVGGGAQFSFAGFTLGGGYRSVDGQSYGTETALPTIGGVNVVANTFQPFDTTVWSAGGSYETGPYKVGVEYVNTQNPQFNGNGDDSERQVLALSGTYVLGPGIRVVGGLFYFDQEAEGTTDGNGAIIGGSGAGVPGGLVTGPRNISDSDGFGGLIGLLTSF